MSAPINPTSTPITFGFRNVYTTYRHDPVARVDTLSARGFQIGCNGIDPNWKLDPDNGQTDLLMRAPRDELIPMITFAPSSTGKIFGTGFKWRYRYSSSKTGETSGMSPVPSVGLTLGTVTSGTSFLGQTAYFKIPGVATTSGIDTIELLRNTSAQDDVWYLVDKASNPGAASYATFTDNNPDEDIWNNEQGSLRVNPTYFEPHPPPCARIYQHHTGRVFLYGHIPMGTYVAGTATVSADDPSVTGASTRWYRGREGQLFRYTTDSTRTQYRTIEVTANTTMYVTPTPKAANGPAAYEIVDDIDSRNIYMMQPLSPVQHDPLDVLTVGQDRSDGVMGIAGLADRTLVLTRHHLYWLNNDKTESPRDTYEIETIANIGCVGFYAWCKTPFGIVFVDETQGVMLFDGANPPRPLGSESPLQDFRPLTQFNDFDRGAMSECYCDWDPIAKRVFVSYCPVGSLAMTRQLSFDPTAAPGGNWRGPWRRMTVRGGRLRNATGSDIYVIGDHLGTLYLDQDIARDGIAATVSGTISTIDNSVQITTTAGVMLSTMVGLPIVFNDGAGNYYVNWIAGFVSTTKVVLALIPSTTLVIGWTFIVGAIHWTARTAYIDLGEPMLPKKLDHVGVRFEPMVTNVDSLVVTATSEGASITESADAAADTETQGLVKGDANVNVGGHSFQVRFSGRASYGGPRITNVLAQFSFGSGTRLGTTADQTKRIITPTASA